MATNSNAIAYDPLRIKATIDTLISNVDMAYDYLGEQMQINVFDHLRFSWYGTQAMRFGPLFEEKWNQLMQDINRTYMEIVSRMNIAANNLARANEEVWANVPYNLPAPKITCNFQEKDSIGLIGITDITRYSDAIDLSFKVKDGALFFIAATCLNVKDSGFVDATTEDALIRSINKIKDAVDDALNGIVHILKTNSDIVKTNLETAQTTNTNMLGEN